MIELNALGIHIIADLFECNKKILKNIKKIKVIAEGAAREAHATIIHTMVSKNSQIGVRVIIAESHISIVPVPEYNLAFVEVFTCGNVIDPSAAVIYISKKLESKKQNITELKMGILSIDEKLPHKPLASAYT